MKEEIELIDTTTCVVYPFLEGPPFVRIILIAASSNDVLVCKGNQFIRLLFTPFSVI